MLKNENITCCNYGQGKWCNECFYSNCEKTFKPIKKKTKKQEGKNNDNRNF